MVSVTVRSLDLKFRAPETLRSRSASLVAEVRDDFLPNVLTAMRRRFDKSFGPQAIIRIRTIRFRCKLQPGELRSNAAELLGEELARQIEESISHPPDAISLPVEGAAVVVFRDTAHEGAAILIRAAERTNADSSATAEIRRLVQDLLVDPAAADPVLVLKCCVELNRLETVMEQLLLEEIAQLLMRADVLQVQHVHSALTVTKQRRLLRQYEAGDYQQSVAAPSEPKVASPELQQKDWQERVSASPPVASTGFSIPIHAHDPTTDSPAENASVTGRDALVGEAAAEKPELQEALPLVDAEPVGLASVLATPEHNPTSGSRELSGHGLLSLDQRVFRTDWAPLLYLLNVALQLDLPERLWQVGLAEGAELAAAFARLGPDVGDPACLVLSRSFPAGPLPSQEVEAWAEQELVNDSLVAATRFLIERSGNENVGSRLRARIDRLLPTFSLNSDRGFDVAAWCAALLIGTTEELLGEELSEDARVARFSRPGLIELADDVIRVVMTLEHLDIDCRRAGLDANPGWLTWLERALVFEFVETGDVESLSGSSF